MAGFHVTIRNQQVAGDKTGGWGENFWNSGTDLTALLPLVAELRGNLDACKGGQTILPSARISDPDTFRLVKQVLYVGSALPAGSLIDSDYPSSALQLKLTAPGPYVTTQWMRGIPDEVVSGGGSYTPGKSPGFLTAINRFIANLTSSAKGWSLRCLNRATVAKPITAVNLTTGIVTIPAHAFTPTLGVVTFRIKGFKIPRGLNRIWKGTIVDANNIQLSFYVPPVATVVPFGFKPTAREQVYVYVPIQTAEIVRATSHYTGKPTGLLGGRRRTRRRPVGGQPVDV